MAIATGEQALAADINAGFTARPKYADGTYTGNGGAVRQIATGFECIFVIILVAGGSMDSARGQWNLVDDATIKHIVDGADPNPEHFNDVANCYLHATDGFVVDPTGGSNSGAVVYYYMALGK